MRVHGSTYHDLVRYDVDNFADILHSGDTAICEDSYDVAMLASGAVLDAVDQVMTGKLSRVFCAVRPPGHHASANVGMGFCIFNHVAVAARYLQQKYSVKKVAILDWDVHHGNGTQDIFYEDGSVFYFSTHQEGIFPMTGLASERGAKKGRGTTLNIPLPADTGDAEVLAAWGAPLKKALQKFQPEFILVSAGFDAVAEDSIAEFNMTPAGFGKLTDLVRGYADELCKGRLVSVLEGGYQIEMLAQCVKTHLKRMV
eukprot:Seg19049.1 transcript_id=Seg19049.1/GoldUCD/mRNA.D3Y31 product="Histone deacetylase 14" protein_id=Seg19049.1/GoldUCD/D3Y31